MTRLLYTTPAHTHTLALDFTPDKLPGRGVLRMWLDAFSENMTVDQLAAALRTGKAFRFAEGTIEWSEENG